MILILLFIFQTYKEVTMKMEDLNSNCPYGYRSTNYYSKQGQAPDLKLAQRARQTITVILAKFKGFHAHTANEFQIQPENRGLFDTWGQECIQIHETVPESLGAIYPVRSSRTAHENMLQLQDSTNQLGQKLLALLQKHTCPRRCLSERATLVMHMLQQDSTELFATLPYKITLADHQMLTLFQDLQERCDLAENIQNLNGLLTRRPEIIDSLLAIQREICKKINSFLKEFPEFEHDTLAFSEFGLWNRHNQQIPSTRLLKIILHNWGMFFLEVADTPFSEMVKHAARRALEENIYKQTIFIVQGAPNERAVHSVITKVCPARTAIGEILCHYCR